MEVFQFNWLIKKVRMSLVAKSKKILPSVPKKVVPFKKSPKCGYGTYYKHFVFISFVHDPNIFQRDKIFAFIT